MSFSYQERSLLPSLPSISHKWGIWLSIDSCITYHIPQAGLLVVLISSATTLHFLAVQVCTSPSWQLPSLFITGKAFPHLLLLTLSTNISHAWKLWNPSPRDFGFSFFLLPERQPCCHFIFTITLLSTCDMAKFSGFTILSLKMSVQAVIKASSGHFAETFSQTTP